MDSSTMQHLLEQPEQRLGIEMQHLFAKQDEEMQQMLDKQ
jgi:hypothetical protein